ncbi:hypothetical protein BV22DRAFT_581350 [Leucogyrophana mollusca]|uniref:Uncharacterized protein n=1 Tax=Leucogyrophana mollusca TaxID=85980 RepID=A0ACB8BF79_9AGAM|nr:hypothetical protein BV22DRAFT_581350 [Leucogyrophana mollusca]
MVYQGLNSRKSLLPPYHSRPIEEALVTPPLIVPHFVQLSRPSTALSWVKIPKLDGRETPRGRLRSARRRHLGNILSHWDTPLHQRQYLLQ